MRVRAILPDDKSLCLESLEHDKTSRRILIRVRTIGESCACPCCGRLSDRVHSRYERSLSDLPWQGLQVRMVWSTRRFFCDFVDCSRKIFVERQSTVAVPYSRRTERLSLAIRCIGFACGGEAGARLAGRLGIQVSPDSLLRQVRKTALPERHSPRAVGVDDWAFRKGHRYGTLICDLESGHVLDLLPDRDAGSVAKWLRCHNGIEIVSRDRGDIYRKGANAGAPHAVQVADRFHLMKNLRDAFGRFLEGQSRQIRDAAGQVQAEVSNELKNDLTTVDAIATTKLQARKAENHRRRHEKHDQIVQLREQGVSLRSIANQLGIYRSTVRKYLQAGSLRDRVPRNYPSTADPFEDYLRDRWQSGCCNAALLWREIVPRGFKGSYWSVRRLLARWRHAHQAHSKSKSPLTRMPSPTQVSWLLFRNSLKLSKDETALKQAVLDHCEEIRAAWQLTLRFIVILRRRKGHHLGRWVKRATIDEVPSPIRQFANGLKKDWEAVVAGLTLHWNNGMAEGHISRLKLIKRQMYGRANFDLLRARFLAAV